MNIPIKLSCPLGHTCEEARDGEIHRCVWFTKLVGKDPQTGQDLDQWSCAVNFLPILLVEVSRNVIGVQAAAESARNETADGAARIASALLEVSRRVGHELPAGAGRVLICE